MTTPKRRYIDELTDGIKASESSPLNDKRVLISLETAKRLGELYEASDYQARKSDSSLGVIIPALDSLDEEMPEPKP